MRRTLVAACLVAAVFPPLAHAHARLVRSSSGERRRACRLAGPRPAALRRRRLGRAWERGRAKRRRLGARRSASCPRTAARAAAPGRSRRRRLQRAVERDLERRPHRPGGVRVRRRTRTGRATAVPATPCARPDDRHDRALAVPARRAGRGRRSDLPLCSLRPRGARARRAGARAGARHGLQGDGGAACGGLRGLHRRGGAAQPGRERFGDALRASARGGGGARRARGGPRRAGPEGAQAASGGCDRDRRPAAAADAVGSRARSRAAVLRAARRRAPRSSPPRSGSAACSRSRPC